MADEWITIARLVKVRGNKGELAAEPLTVKLERFSEAEGAKLFGPDFPDGRPVGVEDYWMHGDRVILKFSGIDSISDAEPFVGTELRIPAGVRQPAPEGEYYQTDLIGCAVVEPDGSVIGQVTGVENYGGPDLLAVGDLLIPFVKAICVEIDVEAKRIVAQLPEGLRELQGS